jgi:hypothetical protein
LKLRFVACDPAPVEDHVVELIGNPIIATAAAAAASLARPSVARFGQWPEALANIAVFNRRYRIY